jgi:hypothetical protein
MADVEMTDAPPKTKTSKTDTAADSGKKRFEVKKVSCALGLISRIKTDTSVLVERRCSLGLGYRCRQLCHLP